MTVSNRRARNKLQRRKPQRESYDRVLIVCEGMQTEVLYFEDLVAQYRLSTVNVNVVGTGSDPRSLVEEAEVLRDNEEKNGEPYDQVYCVFDKDSHTAFEAASEAAQRCNLKLARSWPCFEFWLLLHFYYSRRPYAKTSKSPCENCVGDLRKHLPEYQKSCPSVFNDLLDRLDVAKQHAAQALQDAESTGEPNPCTEIHLLVNYLQKLK